MSKSSRDSSFMFHCFALKRLFECIFMFVDCLKCSTILHHLLKTSDHNKNFENGTFNISLSFDRFLICSDFMSKSDKYSGACLFSALKTMTHVRRAILILGTFIGRVSLCLPRELYGRVKK